MKKRISILLLLGWYFTITTQLPDYPNAKAVAKDGPFANEVDCNDYRSEMMDLFKAVGLRARFDICVEEKEV